MQRVKERRYVNGIDGLIREPYNEYNGKFVYRNKHVDGECKNSVISV